VRVRLLILIVAVLAATAAGSLAWAEPARNGLPAYTDGYTRWPRLNRTPITTPGAHTGIKNVYASKRRVGRRFPNGTVIVKTIRAPGRSWVHQVAVMRKVRGSWRYVEYDRGSRTARYGVLAQGALCQSCHMQARSTDYVFTRR
jgi:hypothetical protein